MKQWYETLFEDYANQYDKENFTQGTLGECDFIEKELNYNKSFKILDVGCGTGRHAIELTELPGLIFLNRNLPLPEKKRLLQILKLIFFNTMPETFHLKMNLMWP